MATRLTGNNGIPSLDFAIPSPSEDPFAPNPVISQLASLQSAPNESDTAYEQPKIGGDPNQPKRKRFTRNTEHFTQRLSQLIGLGLADPIQVLAEIATGRKMTTLPDGSVTLDKFEKDPDHKTRAIAAAELMSYCYPKRKSVEVTGAEGSPIQFVVHADTTDIPQMPDEATIKEMQRERRQQAADAEKSHLTLDGASL